MYEGMYGWVYGWKEGRMNGRWEGRWVRKKKNCRGPCLVPHIKQEKRDGSTDRKSVV